MKLSTKISQSLTPSSPQRFRTLKAGAQVILLVKDRDHRLFCGSRVVVERYGCHDTQNPPSAAVLSWTSAGVHSMFARENLDETVAERADNTESGCSLPLQEPIQSVGPNTRVIEIWLPNRYQPVIKRIQVPLSLDG